MPSVTVKIPLGLVGFPSHILVSGRTLGSEGNLQAAATVETKLFSACSHLRVSGCYLKIRQAKEMLKDEHDQLRYFSTCRGDIEGLHQFCSTARCVFPPC